MTEAIAGATQLLTAALNFILAQPLLTAFIAAPLILGVVGAIIHMGR